MTSNSNFPKKRGRPLGSTNKRKVARKVARTDKSFKQDDTQKAMVEAFIGDLIDQINAQKAIISYLEDKLESK